MTKLSTTQYVRTLLEEQKQRLQCQFVPRDIKFSGIGNKIEVAIGMRRSGKTCTLIQEMQHLQTQGLPVEQMLYLSLDDDRIEPNNLATVADIVDQFYALFPNNHQQLCHLFFDEVHTIEGWPRLIRRLHDTKKVKLWLSGSSAKLLSSEIATELRGRSLATCVWPYSFNEWLRARGEEPQQPIFWGRPSLDYFKQRLTWYMQYGGFPEVLMLDAGQRVSVLQNYVEVVIFRDVVERYHIKNLSAARYLIKTLLRNISRPFSIHKVYNDLRSQGRRIAKDTLYEYVSYFEDAFLCFAIEQHHSSTRKAEVTPKKVYAIDPGLVAAFLPSDTCDLGRRFENLVYLDLRRAGATVSYYNTNDNEVDFVIKWPQGKVELMQVCWDIYDSNTYKREETALKQVQAELGVSGTLLTVENYLQWIVKIAQSSSKNS
ncbi:MAG: ATP-binding protein [Deltaproteobacteria bacterium]|nr:ATP-binding protein [Deltaproteobacteria bacterium]